MFFSTDDINLEKTVSYFSMENIGNIHLLEPTNLGNFCGKINLPGTPDKTEFYLKDTMYKTKDVKDYFEEYEKIDFRGFMKYPNTVYQQHKILDCYNLFKSSADFDDCDYIVRMRFDCKFTANIIDMIELFTENPELDLLIDWDWFAIGKPNIMKCYCNGLDNNLFSYNYKTPVPAVLPVMGYGDVYYFNLNPYIWTYAPERVVFEMLFDYCNKNNLDMNKTIRREHVCSILRNHSP